MSSRGVVLTLTALLVVAGCVGTPALPTSFSPGHARDPVRSLHSSHEWADHQAATFSVTNVTVASEEAGRPPVPPSPTVSMPTNPWRKPTVVVGINDTSTGNRSFEPLVSEALAYWERNDRRYTDFDVDFVLVPNATNPDVLVRFADTVECNGKTGWLGCAPVLNDSSVVTDTQVVTIRTGYTDNSTEETLKHEFGHLLGLHHGDPPVDVMKPTNEATALPQPDATDRKLPWLSSTLYVYVDYASVPTEQRGTVQAQVEEALRYYENYPGDRVPNVSFVVTNDRSRANVVIDFSGAEWCSTTAGSCGRNYGYDTDGDGKLEYYTLTRITLVGVRPDAVGWHVSYWLGKALGLDDTTLPNPLHNGTKRTGEWWKEGPNPG